MVISNPMLVADTDSPTAADDDPVEAADGEANLESMFRSPWDTSAQQDGKIKGKIKGKIGNGIAKSRDLRQGTLHKYESSPHLGASLWSEERKDTPMYFGHTPEQGRALTATERIVDWVADALFVMLLPALVGFLPFFVPLGGKDRVCVIPGGVRDAFDLSSNASDLALLPSSGAHSNVTVLDATIPCAEIRTSAFIFYTCPLW
eukprot:COSAG02_NODE_8253_length_2640_cov_8.817001_2_plen_204_part_00